MSVGEFTVDKTAELMLRNQTIENAFFLNFPSLQLRKQPKKRYTMQFLFCFFVFFILTT